MGIREFLQTNDPALNFRWKAVGFAQACQLDDQYVEKMTAAWARFESSPLYVDGSNNYYHSVVDHEPINVSFYLDKTFTAVTQIMEWSKLVCKDGRYGLPVNYKKNFEMHLLANDSDSAMAVFQVIGAWPSGMDDLELSYDSSDRLILTVNFSVDEIRFIGGGGGGSGRASANINNNANSRSKSKTNFDNLNTGESNQLYALTGGNDALSGRQMDNLVRGFAA